MNKITDGKIYFAIDERIDRVVEMFELRNEELENRIKELENHNINNIIKRVENIEIIISSSVDGEPCIIKRVEELEGKMAQNNTAICNETSNLNNKIDDLEAKNYELRSELDGIYKVLEMDACDIQKLQDETITIKELRKFKDWDEFNEAMKEGHETIRQVTLNKIQIKNNKDNKDINLNNKGGEWWLGKIT